LNVTVESGALHVTDHKGNQWLAYQEENMLHFIGSPWGIDSGLMYDIPSQKFHQVKGKHLSGPLWL
jgi:hypothetical protein